MFVFVIVCNALSVVCCLMMLKDVARCVLFVVGRVSFFGVLVSLLRVGCFLLCVVWCNSLCVVCCWLVFASCRCVMHLRCCLMFVGGWRLCLACGSLFVVVRCVLIAVC